MGKMEVIVRTERRRKWSEADRARILAECDQPGVTVRDVSERYQVSESVIYGWRAERRQKAMEVIEPLRFIRCGEIPELGPDTRAPSAGTDGAHVPSVKATRMDAPGLAIDGDPAPPESPDPPGNIKIHLPTGERLTVDSFVNEKALARVLRSLRDVR